MHSLSSLTKLPSENFLCAQASAVYKRKVLELYGEKLLQQNQETIVGQSSEEISAMLADRYEYYLNLSLIHI